MIRDAVFSSCGKYRYALFRVWDSGPTRVMFVGLNPSTADATNDDPTIRRCVAFAKSWGYSGLFMTNLFAYRATAPREMLSAIDPVGSTNDLALTTLASVAKITVAAWGAHGTHRNRHIAVQAMIPNLHYLRLTKSGHPGHPLYLPGDLQPKPYFQKI